MSYSVQVPIGEELEFPNHCPFSGAAAPRGVVRLKISSTSLVVPLPGGFLNSYSTTRFRIPAKKMVAVLAMGLEVMMWLSMFGGMLTAGLLSSTDGPVTKYAGLFLVGGLVVALGCRILRWVVLWRVRIGNAWNGFVEVRFSSESYAREFSELNRLAFGS